VRNYSLRRALQRAARMDNRKVSNFDGADWSWEAIGSLRILAKAIRKLIPGPVCAGTADS
jgi:hypothetical protein